jgi:hypothetical protein
MTRSLLVRKSIAVCLFLISAVTFAQAAGAEFEPRVGQEGKDVIWVPTCQALVDKMLDMAKLTPKDYNVDLGSGDGRTVITAAKRGAQALGIEYNPEMVALSRKNAAKEGVADRAQFIQADLFKSDFSKATVLTMFLLEEINLKLRPRILNLKPGTRVVSNHFTMGDWTADETSTVEGEDCSVYNTAYLWIVPAKVGGKWKVPNGELTLTQKFQILSGTLKSGAKSSAVSGGKITGDEIRFTVGGATYTGLSDGRTVRGTVESGGQTTPWSATRIGK